MNKNRGQVSPDLVLQLAKVEYLCRSGHEAHSLWDVFLSPRAQDTNGRRTPEHAEKHIF